MVPGLEALLIHAYAALCLPSLRTFQHSLSVCVLGASMSDSVCRGRGESESGAKGEALGGRNRWCTCISGNAQRLPVTQTQRHFIKNCWMPGSDRVTARCTQSLPGHDSGEGDPPLNLIQGLCLLSVQCESAQSVKTINAVIFVLQYARIAVFESSP